jgi:pSer/pThr/pTyr-binding forkhead associated (FHA) protein
LGKALDTLKQLKMLGLTLFYPTYNSTPACCFLISLFSLFSSLFSPFILIQRLITMLTLKSIDFEQRTFQKHQLEQAYSGQTEWVIGRHKPCDLILANPKVSRIHAQITYEENAYYFMDLGSWAGSTLNGEDMSVTDKRQLQIGDLLQLGEASLYVDVLTPPFPNSDQAVEQLGHEPLEKRMATKDLPCRCYHIVEESPDVKTFYLMAEPPVLFDYKPGQFVNLEVEIDGKSVIRPYPITFSPTQPYRLSVTIKRVPSFPGQMDVPTGKVSNWLHDHLKEGDRVKLVNGPEGDFTCLPDLPSELQEFSQSLRMQTYTGAVLDLLTQKTVDIPGSFELCKRLRQDLHLKNADHFDTIERISNIHPEILTTTIQQAFIPMFPPLVTTIARSAKRHF